MKLFSICVICIEPFSWLHHFVTIVDVFGKNVVMGQCHLQKFKVVADCSWIQSTCTLLLHYTTGFCPNPVFKACNKSLCSVLSNSGMGRILCVKYRKCILFNLLV